MLLVFYPSVPLLPIFMADFLSCILKGFLWCLIDILVIWEKLKALAFRLIHTFVCTCCLVLFNFMWWIYMNTQYCIMIPYATLNSILLFSVGNFSQSQTLWRERRNGCSTSLKVCCCFELSELILVNLNYKETVCHIKIYQFLNVCPFEISDVL